MKQKSFNDTKGCNLYNNTSTFVSPIYTSSLARNINVYTPIRSTNMENYFDHITYKGKMPTLAGIKHLPSISSVPDRVFSIFRRKMYGSSPLEMDIKMLTPAPTQKIITKTKDRNYSP